MSIKAAEIIGNGAGAPTIAADRSNLTVKFEGVSAAVESEKAVDLDHCQLSLTVEVPEGYEYALSALHGAGRVTLPPFRERHLLRHIQCCAPAVAPAATALTTH